MKTVFGVQWVEVEFGERPEGWYIFLDKDTCIEATRKASREGEYSGGYLGPARPLVFYEIPYSCLDTTMKAQLRKTGKASSSNFWRPKFRSAGTRI